MSREKIRINTLKDIKEEFDFVLIDCPSSLGILTMNALGAAHSVLVPTQPQYFSAKGMTQLFRTIRSAKMTINPDLKAQG